MAISVLGTLIKKGVELGQRARLRKPKPAFDQQKAMLETLLTKAEETAFGQAHGFAKVLNVMEHPNPRAFYQQYTKQVPISDYNRMFSEWWYRALAGEADVAWPGRVRYFALSSGTSEASTKHIPVTGDMIKAIQKTSTQQILALPNFKAPAQTFTSGVLMLGGSTNLNHHGHYYDGDMSGIQASRIPVWFQRFYKPGKKIATQADWNTKLEEITRKAPDWNIGIITGVPAWVQLLFERIIERYQVNTIHDVWPNLAIYVHGGVSFEPYRRSFDKLVGKPLAYMETYIASEGYIAYQKAPGHDMQIVLDKGLFYEFIPFDDANFTADGDLVAQPQTLMVDQVEEGKDYAILLSTCSGAWRYLIGDVVRFTNKERLELIVAGRTKHFLSLCGEHLSVDNMTKAVTQLAEELKLEISEFTVAGVNTEKGLFGHHWYLGIDTEAPAEAELARLLDEKLKVLNDDYAVERLGPLHEVKVQVVPTRYFYEFMKFVGKDGGQNKTPRVLKKKQLEGWLAYLATQV